MKTRFVSKHAAVIVWFNQQPLDPADGWREGQPGDGRVVAVRSVLYSDGSSKCWYRMAAVKKKCKKNSKREKRVKKK
jgi:hypothetical protein